jgi:hypothetical protein
MRKASVSIYIMSIASNCCCWTIVTSLTSLDTNKPSKAAEVVKRGILYFYGVLASQQFQAPPLMSDGAGAVGKLVTELNSLGVEVDISGAGGHVPRVERRKQVVKERSTTSCLSL